MSRTIPVTLTNMCMITNPSGQVLVQNRLNPDWPGITFPGGHVEPNESITESVIREVYEETGLTISNPILCGIKDWTNTDGSRYIVLLFKTSTFEGEISASDEGEVFWTDLNSITQLNLSVDFDLMLEIFLRNELSEFYYEFDGIDWQPRLY